VFETATPFDTPRLMAELVAWVNDERGKAQLHPLLTIATFGMWNLDDNSWQLRPQLQISLSDNLSLDLAHSFNVGAGLATGARPWIKIPQSEFGLYADTTSLFLRWYF